MPTRARLAPDPFDNAHVYVTLREISDVVPPAFPYLRYALRRVPVHEALLAVAKAMSSIRSLSGDDDARELDQQSLQYFQEPARGRLARKLNRGAVVHAPQLLMVLAKLILRYCPHEVTQADRVSAPLPFLLLLVADMLDPLASTQQQKAPSIDEITLELAANTHFNTPLRIDSHLADFQRRWIEMPRDSTSRYLSQTMEQVFRDATGYSLLDQIAVCLAISMGAAEGRPNTSASSYFASVRWDPARYEPILNRISLPLNEYQETISRELGDRSVDWHFSTFERYPLIRSGDDYLALDANMVLRRSVGFLPFFDVEEGYERKGERRKIIKVKAAFDDYAERYAGEVIHRIAQQSGQGVSVLTDADFRREFKNQKIADFALIYGPDTVVIEVTTSRPRRDTVNAVSTTSLAKDIALIVDEAEQVSSTIDGMRRSAPAAASQPRRSRYYPVVILAEGFPNNFVIAGRVRDAIFERGILQGEDVAPLELMTLGDLDIVEDQAERAGLTLPQLLGMKAKSNFRADSIKNFLLSDSRFTIERTTRVEEASQRFFSLAMKQFGWEPQEVD